MQSSIDFFNDVCYNGSTGTKITSQHLATLSAKNITKRGFGMSYYYSGYGRRSWDPKLVLSVGLIVVCVLICIARPINKVSDIRTIEGTVTEKTVKRSDDEDKYLVFVQQTTSGGGLISLEITDSLLYGRFNSSDVYAGIEVGKTYSFEVGGSRVPILSWYPNIYSYEEITTE